MIVLSKYTELREKVMAVCESDWSVRDIVNWRDYLRGLAAQDEITAADAENLISLLPAIDLSIGDKEIDKKSYMQSGRKGIAIQKAYDELEGGTKIVSDYSKRERTSSVTRSYDADNTKDFSGNYGASDKKRSAEISAALDESAEEKMFPSYPKTSKETRHVACDVVTDFDTDDAAMGVYGSAKKADCMKGPSLISYDEEDDDI